MGSIKQFILKSNPNTNIAELTEEQYRAYVKLWIEDMANRRRENQRVKYNRNKILKKEKEVRKALPVIKNLEPPKYKSYRLRANAKSVVFKLTQEEFINLIESDCCYCGGAGGGIDRVNPKDGYTKENSAPCCWKCNNMKYTHSIEDFVNHVKKIYNFILEKENNIYAQ